MALTGCLLTAARARSERIAVEALKYNGWELEPALEAYFSHAGSFGPVRSHSVTQTLCCPPPRPSSLGSSLPCAPARVACNQPQVDQKKLDAFFSQYKEDAQDVVGVDGVIKLCSDLEVITPPSPFTCAQRTSPAKPYASTTVIAGGVKEWRRVGRWGRRIQ